MVEEEEQEVVEEEKEEEEHRFEIYIRSRDFGTR